MSETKKTDTAAQAAVPGQASAPDEREVLLKVENLTKHFPIKKGILRRQVGAVKAVDGIDFEVRKGETLGVVGESGCGKSTMGRVITRLQDPTGGTIAFEGQDITRLSTGDMRPLRRDIQMIFQDPYGSLNPRHTIGSIVSAPFRLQGVEPEGGVKKEVQRLLELVGLSPEHYNRYPHEFSGGQRQRIGIARALALKPKLVVADEPVSALDVSIQAQVVNLMDDLQQELGLTYVIIAHDLSVVRHVSDRIAVMYLGKIVELADRNALYEAPMHPYTKALMSAVPVPDTKRRGQKSERILLRGDVPSPIAPPSGCRFHTRCWKATEICRTTEPQLVELKPGQRVACHHPENFADQAPQDTVLLSAAKEASELVPDAVLAGGTPDGPATGTEPAAQDAAEAKSGAVKTTSPKPGSPAEAGDAPVAKAGTESEATAEAAPGPVPEVTESESATGLSSAPDAKPEPAAESESESESVTVAKPETAAKAATEAAPEPVAEEAKSKPLIGISLGPDAKPDPAAEAETETTAKAATDADPEPVAEETNSAPGDGTSAEPGSKAEPAAEAAAEAEPGAAPDAPKAKGK
ncbi:MULTISPECIES: dipeptide ABC transporter ATP-binding protein [unclassified Streptomyces]|uniref:dipeptide ABC transporter ATP-binding protein n=1 Tax=unclassified Streptomyces TaxID=2593676 RepID=UPI000DC3D5BB|nr:dipeptide ABC transporter ATP-binding protein [Streptomyces sp. PsTaAH-130]RAJ49911.1 peptide/nickel transport system ATP-binding protein [Streptomyces sp. PsTaAH-130]